jgi:hypothetical protein
MIVQQEMAQAVSYWTEALFTSLQTVWIRNWRSPTTAACPQSSSRFDHTCSRPCGSHWTSNGPGSVPTATATATDLPTHTAQWTSGISS